MVELVSEILTYTQKRFDPLHPCVDQSDIEDIAHALSMLCRTNGHFKTFYLCVSIASTVPTKRAQEAILIEFSWRVFFTMPVKPTCLI